MSSHLRVWAFGFRTVIITINIRITVCRYKVIKSYCFFFQRELVQRRSTSATAATEQEQKTIVVSHCFLEHNIIHIKCILLVTIYICVCIALYQVKFKIIIVTNLYIYMHNTYYDVILNKI